MFVWLLGCLGWPGRNTGKKLAAFQARGRTTERAERNLPNGRVEESDTWWSINTWDYHAEALWWIYHRAWSTCLCAWLTTTEQRVCSNSQKNTCCHLLCARMDNVVQRGPAWLSKEDKSIGRAGERKGPNVHLELRAARPIDQEHTCLICVFVH